MANFPSLSYFLSILLPLTIIIVIIYDASAAAAAAAASGSKSAEMVDKVCKKASSYRFCNESLYSDPRTPHASGFDLAYISVGLAYANATSTQKLIFELIEKNVSDKGHVVDLRLERCRIDYAGAVSEIAEASNDVNSEDFYELPDLAGNASRAADDCQAAYQGIPSNPLGRRNLNLKGLCEIFAIVAKLFTSS